jgi:hypothetical protein
LALQLKLALLGSFNLRATSSKLGLLFLGFCQGRLLLLLLLFFP